MSRILGIVRGCRECPHRQYYSGGVNECDKVRQALPANVEIPEWCPLPPHPAHAMEQLRAELVRLRATEPQEEKHE